MVQRQKLSANPVSTFAKLLVEVLIKKLCLLNFAFGYHSIKMPPYQLY